MTTIARASKFTKYICQDKIVASTTNIKKPTVPQTIETDNNSFQSHSFISKTPPFRTPVTLQRERTKKSMFELWKTQPWIRHNFPGEVVICYDMKKMSKSDHSSAPGTDAVDMQRLIENAGKFRLTLLSRECVPPLPFQPLLWSAYPDPEEQHPRHRVCESNDGGRSVGRVHRIQYVSSR